MRFAFLGFYAALGPIAVLFSSDWAHLPGQHWPLSGTSPSAFGAATMYIVTVGFGTLLCFERLHWQSALPREQRLRSERSELSLATAIKTLPFSIANKALANAFQHADRGRVDAFLRFAKLEIT